MTASDEMTGMPLLDVWADRLARRRNAQLFAPEGVIVEGVERADVEHLVEKMRWRAIAEALADLEAIGVTGSSEVAELRDALRPFAQFAQCEDAKDATTPDGMPVVETNTYPIKKTLTVGDFRRAAKALAWPRF